MNLSLHKKLLKHQISGFGIIALFCLSAGVTCPVFSYNSTLTNAQVKYSFARTEDTTTWICSLTFDTLPAHIWSYQNQQSGKCIIECIGQTITPFEKVITDLSPFSKISITNISTPLALTDTMARIVITHDPSWQCVTSVGQDKTISLTAQRITLSSRPLGFTIVAFILISTCAVALWITGILSVGTQGK